jgi:hypothetical protein
VHRHWHQGEIAGDQFKTHKDDQDEADRKNERSNKGNPRLFGRRKRQRGGDT